MAEDVWMEALVVEGDASRCELLVASESLTSEEAAVELSAEEDIPATCSIGAELREVSGIGLPSKRMALAMDGAFRKDTERGVVASFFVGVFP